MSYNRMRDLVDQHDPDLLYFDNALLPLGWGGMNVGAYFYNHNLKTQGKMGAVLNIKNVPDRLAKSVVVVYEHGLTNEIMSYPWQSERHASAIGIIGVFCTINWVNMAAICRPAT